MVVAIYPEKGNLAVIPEDLGRVYCGNDGRSTHVDRNRIAASREISKEFILSRP